MATDGKVGGQKGEVRNNLEIIVIIFRNSTNGGHGVFLAPASHIRLRSLNPSGERLPAVLVDILLYPGYNKYLVLA